MRKREGKKGRCARVRAPLALLPILACRVLATGHRCPVAGEQQLVGMYEAR